MYCSVVFLLFLFLSVFAIDVNVKPINLDKGKDLDPTKVVEIEVLYETKCKPCKKFVCEQLIPTYEKIPESLHIVMVPYGKANVTIEGDKIIIMCQHGEDECLGNRIHACLIEQLQDVEKYLPVIGCMENLNGTQEELLAKCAAEFSLDTAPILKCAHGDHGLHLQKAYGAETDKFTDKKFVPYIALNGRHLSDDEHKNLLDTVCKALSDKPQACLDVTKD